MFDAGAEVVGAAAAPALDAVLQALIGIGVGHHRAHAHRHTQTRQAVTGVVAIGIFGHVIEPVARLNNLGPAGEGQGGQQKGGQQFFHGDGGVGKMKEGWYRSGCSGLKLQAQVLTQRTLQSRQVCGGKLTHVLASPRFIGCSVLINQRH